MTNLYTVSSIEKLIADYRKAGGQMLQMRHGTHGCGDVLLYDESGKLKTYVIREVILDEQISGQAVRCYQKIPAKYQAMVDAKKA